jgi:hypothetical protein
MEHSLIDNKTDHLEIHKEIKQLKYYLLAIAGFFILGYFAFFIFDDKLISILYREDGLFEFFSALFLLLTSLTFLLLLYLKKNILYFFLFCLFLFGFGEEISWGQRMLLFETPEFIKEKNVQEEFNVHNLQIFSSPPASNPIEKIIYKLLDMNVMYKIFYFSWCLFLPLLYAYFTFVKTLSIKINLPVPPISIGFFFVINLIIYVIIKFNLSQASRPPLTFRALQEASEFCASAVFLVLSSYFLLNTIKVRD